MLLFPPFFIITFFSFLVLWHATPPPEDEMMLLSSAGKLKWRSCHLGNGLKTSLGWETLVLEPRRGRWRVVDTFNCFSNILITRDRLCVCVCVLGCVPFPSIDSAREFMTSFPQQIFCSCHQQFAVLNYECSLLWIWDLMSNKRAGEGPCLYVPDRSQRNRLPSIFIS